MKFKAGDLIKSHYSDATAKIISVNVALKEYYVEYIKEEHKYFNGIHSIKRIEDFYYLGKRKINHRLTDIFK